MLFTREPSRRLADALRRIHRDARFVFHEGENSWWVARMLRPGSVIAENVELLFRLAGAGGVYAEPGEGALCNARACFDYKANPRARMLQRLKAKADAVERAERADHDEFTQWGLDMARYIKRKLQKQGLDDSLPRSNLDRAGRKEVMMRPDNARERYEHDIVMGYRDVPRKFKRRLSF